MVMVIAVVLVEYIMERLKVGIFAPGGFILLGFNYIVKGTVSIR